MSVNPRLQATEGSGNPDVKTVNSTGGDTHCLAARKITMFDGQVMVGGVAAGKVRKLMMFFNNRRLFPKLIVRSAPPPSFDQRLKSLIRTTFPAPPLPLTAAKK